VEFFKAIGPARIGAMFAVVAMLIGFFAIVIMRLSAPVMVPLYTDLTFDDSRAIIRQLDSLGTPYEMRQDGSVILVPKDAVLRTRMDLAEQGLPSGGTVGYEIFDKTDALGTTSFVQSVNHLRALEGELSRTITAINRIAAARVHLVLPERKLFQRDREEPSASIVLRVRGGLETAQIRAIQHLVATAVEGLKPGRVSIVDESGQLLASGDEEEGVGFVTNALQERTVAYERRLRDSIEEILSEVVGHGRARVQVSAELDFNRVTQTSQVFDPDGQVVRSSQTREEASKVGREQDNAVTAANQLPGAAENSGADGDTDRERTSSNEEVTNYEISKTERTEVVEAGRIKRVSVAVLVDGIYTQKTDGQMDYTPRSAEELERIAALVRSAAGFDKERGDLVEVVNLRFAEAPSQLPLDVSEAGLFDLTKRDLFYFAELGVIVLLTLLTLLFVVRPLVRKIVDPDKAAQGQPVEAATAMIAGPDGEMVALPAPSQEDKTDWFEAAQAEGESHANSIERVGGMIETYPNEALSIVRSWLNEAAA